MQADLFEVIVIFPVSQRTTFVESEKGNTSTLAGDQHDIEASENLKAADILEGGWRA